MANFLSKFTNFCYQVKGRSHGRLDDTDSEIADPKTLMVQKYGIFVKHALVYSKFCEKFSLPWQQGLV